MQPFVSTFSSVEINRNLVETENSSSNKPNKTDTANLHTHKEVFSNLLDKLSLHYGVNMRDLVKL